LKNLVLIPARSGSKRLKNKNKLMLNGIPLVEHTIRFATKYKLSNYILISTDDQEILNIAFKYKILTPWLRPKNLCRDNSKSISFAMHAIRWFEKTFGKLDNIILLQPTSPFRSIKTFKKMYQFFLKQKHSVVTVNKLLKKDKKIYSIKNNKLLNMKINNKTNVNISGNIYINSVKNLRMQRNFVNIHSLPYLIDNEDELIDIDYKSDFENAKKKFNKKK